MTEAEIRCELTDLIQSQCAHCLGLQPEPLHGSHAELPGQRTLFGGGVIYAGVPASFESWCPVCHDDIELGNLISKIEAGWVHVECA